MKKILIAFLLFIFATPAMAFHVTGRILDAKDNQPLFQAGVCAKTNRTCALTDFDGMFDLILNDDRDDTTIEISSVGYQKKEMVPTIEHSDLGTILLDPIEIELDEVVVTEKNKCATDAELKRLNAAKAENITTGKKLHWSREIQNADGTTETIEGDTTEGICIPTICISNSFILENPATVKAVCTPCTSKVPHSTDAYVDGNVCVALKCKNGFTKISGQCVVDCNTESVLKSLHATSASPKPNVSVPANTTRNFASYCYPTACDTPRYDKRGTGESTTCFDLDKQSCTPTDTAHATTGKYEWRTNDKRLLCKPDCIGSNYAAKLNETKTDYYCAIKKKPHEECTPKEIRDLKKSATNPLDPHATKGNVVAWDDKTNVVTACSVTECEKGWKPAKENPTDEYNTKCVSVAGDPCTPDDVVASAGVWEIINNKRVCQPTACNYTDYYDLNTTKTIHVCALKENVPCPSEAITRLKIDEHASASVVTKVDPKSGRVTACKITDCTGEYKPNNNGTKCEKPKCQCGHDWNETTSQCESKIGEKCDAKNATAATRQCPNGATGKEICKIEKCNDDYRHDEKNNKCIYMEGDACTQVTDPKASPFGAKYVKVPKSTRLVCKPASCTPANHTVELNAAQNDFECKRDTACTDPELKQYNNATEGKAEIDENGNLKRCIITACKSGYIPNKDNTACKPTKCKCNQKESGDTCVDLVGDELNCTIDNAASAKYQCPNGPDGGHECIVEKCINDSYESESTKGKSCVSKEGKPCDVIGINYASKKGTYDTINAVNGTPLCRPNACIYSTYSVRLNDSHTAYECVLTAETQVGQECTPTDPNAKSGYVKEGDWDETTGAIKKCTIKECKDDTFDLDTQNNKCVSKINQKCNNPTDKNAKPDGTLTMLDGKLVCKPKACKYDTYKVQENDSHTDYECVFDDSNSMLNKPCTPTDTNAKSGYVKDDADWDKNTLKVNKCTIKDCKNGYIVNPENDTQCIKDPKIECLQKCGFRWNEKNKNCYSIIDTNEAKCTASNAKEAKIVCDGDKEICKISECNKGYRHDKEHNTCVLNVGQSCKEEIPHAAVATWHKKKDSDDTECLVDACEKNYNPSKDKKSCIAVAVLSEEDKKKEMEELAANTQKMKEKENSLANKTIGSAGIGATGIGGMMIGSAISEQAADADAERAMSAYLETFRCDYGSGQNVKGGTVNNELPGGNDMFNLYTQYATLANDLKVRKEALGMKPGIESEVVVDKATTGLYDDVGTGITGGGYASVARALADPNGEDAKKWNEQKKKTSNTLTAGVVTAGVGAVGSLTANIAVNSGEDKQNKSGEILSKYELKKTVPAAEPAEPEAPTE